MGANVDELAEPLRTSVRKLIAESGGKVTVTSTRRTRDEQIQLRIKNGCPDIYDSPASSCDIPTARPGESKHETGEAVDFTNTDTVIAIVQRLAPKYQLEATVPGERWHYQHTGAATQGAPQGDTQGASTGSSFGRITAALRLVVDPSTWLRILQVLAGFVLILLGLALMGKDIAGRLAARTVAVAT